jgi:pimeloyl-ACP methyl ester carboxylesterase
MSSTKASSLASFAADRGYGMTRFDYSGHGLTDIAFENCTIGMWLKEAEAVFASVTNGPQIIIGSSMGGHIALMLLKRLLAKNSKEAARIPGLVLIAPAWDMTEELMWRQFTEPARRELMEKGVYMRPSEYGAPYPITRALIDDGRNHLLGRAPFDPGRPVVILQGLQDGAVPAAHARELLQILAGAWVRMIEIPDGEHRLSRPQDLELLYAAIDGIAAH